MTKFIKDIVSANGNASTTRVCTLLIVAIILIVYVAVNVVAMIKGSGYQDFPTNSVMVLLVALGAKVGQHISETFEKKKIEQIDEQPK
jgi:uncharacterized membrane protein YfcA